MKALLLQIFAVLVLFAPALAQAGPNDCFHENFQVTDTKTRRESDYIVITGKLVNMGANACGVQLQASTYDKSASLLDTANFWPASVRNIAPGASENFKYMLRFDKAVAKYNVVPIDAKVWRQR